LRGVRVTMCLCAVPHLQAFADAAHVVHWLRHVALPAGWKDPPPSPLHPSLIPPFTHSFTLPPSRHSPHGSSMASMQVVVATRAVGAVCDVRSLVNDFAAATNGAARPVLAQMWQRCLRQGRAQFRRRCARGEPSPGADVAGASPVPVQMWEG
jgi:hypothetical protein